MSVTNGSRMTGGSAKLPLKPVAQGWVWGLGLVSCAANTGPGTQSPPYRAPMATTIVHESCPVGRAIAVDVNLDGRPDSLELKEANVVQCRAVDLNFDGEMDDWSYFDPSGAIRRRESDFDRNGSIDEVTIYLHGVLTEKRRATAVRGQWDTWHYYVEGRINRTERDANADGYIDQWWEYPANAKASCPLIHSDVDGDGRPDPGATIDLCGSDSLDEGDMQAPEDSGSDTKSSVGEVPTEVTSDESRSQPEEGEPNQ